jgi:hypothetical protein
MKIGFLAALQLMFIGLKLGHVIDWSWAWVLGLLWARLCLLGIVFIAEVWIAVVEQASRPGRRTR